MSKAVLVTGGAKRLGRAIAIAAAEAGWVPVIHYNTSRDEAETLAEDTGGFTVSADLSAPDQAAKLIQQASNKVGRPLTGLVNSASIFRHDLAQTTTEAALLENLQIHAVAPIMLAQAFAARCPSGAVIVNMLDQKLFNLNPDHFAYTVSKQALHGATLTLSLALAPKVRVVGVAPGYNLPSPGQPDDVFTRLAPTVNLMARRLDPRDVADAVVFALTNKAITGQVILADNGEHLKAAARDIVFTEPS